MAVLKGSVIGELSGKLGNLAARIIDGRTILAQRPVSFNVSYVPSLVEVRKKFAVTGAFVKNLITFSALYAVWLLKKEDGMSVFNYAFKKNFPESSADKPTVDNMLTPADGFALSVTQATVEPTAVTILISPLNTVMVPTNDDVDIAAEGLICYYNPTNPEDAPFAITTLTRQLIAFDAINPVTVDYDLNVVQQAMAAKYQNSILYLSLVTLNADGEPNQYSATYSKNN